MEVHPCTRAYPMHNLCTPYAYMGKVLDGGAPMRPCMKAAFPMHTQAAMTTYQAMTTCRATTFAGSAVRLGLTD